MREVSSDSLNCCQELDLSMRRESDDVPYLRTVAAAIAAILSAMRVVSENLLRLKNRMDPSSRWVRRLNQDDS